MEPWREINPSNLARQFKGVQMATHRLERKQRSIGMLGTAMVFGLMFTGFVWVMFEILAL
jgi:hypothetical protein